MKKNILVIDDEAAVRKAFDLALRDTNFKVDTAASGTEGVEKIKKVSYDLVYLDLRMPGIDGVETLRRIREIDENLPVYIVTAFHREYFQDLCDVRSEKLNFELLCKPLERDQIIQITRGILEGAEALGDNEHV